MTYILSTHSTSYGTCTLSFSPQMFWRQFIENQELVPNDVETIFNLVSSPAFQEKELDLYVLKFALHSKFNHSVYRTFSKIVSDLFDKIDATPRALSCYIVDDIRRQEKSWEEKFDPLQNIHEIQSKLTLCEEHEKDDAHNMLFWNAIRLDACEVWQFLLEQTIFPISKEMLFSAFLYGATQNNEPLLDAILIALEEPLDSTIAFFAMKLATDLGFDSLAHHIIRKTSF